jgi:hypothetical protein
MLYPFWGDIALAENDPDHGRFDEYIANGKEVFEWVDTINASDYVVLPFEYAFDKDRISLAENIALEAKKYHKKLIVFFNSDDTRDITIDNTIVFRTSFFKSQQRANEFAFPGWSIDFMKKMKPTSLLLPKANTPKISYCGYVDYLEAPKKSVLGKIKALFVGIQKESLEYGSYIRGKAVRILRTSKLVACDFIIRDGFWAQGIDDKLKVREEYMANMFNSPYALVTRGAGNFSYRLCEVMSCGRIPVFINTDSILPCEQLINWRKQTVWIEEKELKNIDQHIANFHKFISDADFKDLQQQNRKLYETYLSPLGFFKHLYSHL